MKMTLNQMPRTHPGFTTWVGSLYPESYALFRQMADQDPRFLFYALRPVGDELWNMIDGERSIGQIIEACLIEFGFDVRPRFTPPCLRGPRAKRVDCC